jgi:hypothetical protein
MPYLSSTAMPLLSLVLRSRGRPGSPSRRVGRTDFVAECSAEMVATENELHSRAVIAIAVYDDPWYHLTRDAVQEAVEQSLGVHRWDVEVNFYRSKSFLVLLPTPALHDHVLAANSGITVGHATLQLWPWTRLAGAEAIKLSFKVRLCIEGVPHHAQQSSTLQKLLPMNSLFDCIDFKHRNDNKAQCCYITV